MDLATPLMTTKDIMADFQAAVRANNEQQAQVLMWDTVRTLVDKDVQKYRFVLTDAAERESATSLADLIKAVVQSPDYQFNRHTRYAFDPYIVQDASALMPRINTDYLAMRPVNHPAELVSLALHVARAIAKQRPAEAVAKAAPSSLTFICEKSGRKSAYTIYR